MLDLTILDHDMLRNIGDPVYLVGGTVRDLLAGRVPADIDLVVAGDIHRVAARIASKNGGTVVDLGNKGFDVLRVASEQVTIDITSLDGATIEADLMRRDFTINALAYDIRSRRLVDCTGGRSDLGRKTIRMVSRSALEDDPARLVRAYRMAAVFGFSIHAHTRQAIARERHRIGGVAGERIWAELVKLFAAHSSAPVIRQMADDGLLTAIFPELEPAKGCTQNRCHQFDVFEHSLRVYEHLETLLASLDTRFPEAAVIAEMTNLAGHTVALKYASLLHDVGKPASRRIDAAGRVRFYGHAAESARITCGISRRLRLSRKQRDGADAIVRSHIRTLFLFQAAEKNCLGRRGMVRFFNHCGRLTLPIVVHTVADIAAKRRDLSDRDTRFVAFCRKLLQAYADHLDRQQTVPPLISGRDLISIFGLPPSPRFKRLLQRVDERRLSGELTTREQALDWVRSHIASEDG